MRRNKSLFSRKNFNLIKNLKGNRQMQYAKQQIFLSQIQHLIIFARVNKKKKKGLISTIMQILICYYQSPSQKKEINKST